MPQNMIKHAASTLIVGFFMAMTVAQPTAAQPASSEDLQAVKYAKGLSRAFRRAARIASPSVVKIETTTRAQMTRGGRNNPFRGTPFEEFFDNDERGFSRPLIPPQQGVGSGVIIDASGLILTNNHVVEGADKVIVYLSDGRKFETTDVKADPQTDLAILRIQDAGRLPEARLGDSSQVEIGDWVIAIGHPFSLEQTVSAGIISGKGRQLGSIQRAQFLQTDAAINPGNSGGPLVNLDGEVVGINTAIASSSGGYQGIGFAIPVNLAKWVIPQLIDRGTVQRAYLGVGIQELTPALAAKFGVPPRGGVVVPQVFPDTPAAGAGIREGDVIAKFADRSVRTQRELQEVVERAALGSRQRVDVVRNGRPIVLRVAVEKMPERFGRGSDREAVRSVDADERTYFDAKLGLEVAGIGAETAERIGFKGYSGVLVTRVEPGGAAFGSNIRQGMLIRQVGGASIKDLDDFEDALKSEKLDTGILLLVRTPRGQIFLVIEEV